MGLVRLLAIIVSVTLAFVACGAAPTQQPASAAARTELRSLIEDVTQSSAYQYRLTDDRGRWMDSAKIIWIEEARTFAAVYHTWDDETSRFETQLATSSDLFDWTWRAGYATQASQPTIAPIDGGGYVLAWEQEPDPIHIVIESFASWEDLLATRAAAHFDVPITMPACGEGTPDVIAASPTRVDLSFHYHGGCERDREAQGATDWSTWSAIARSDIDQALIDRGVTGHIGDRDAITFRGEQLTLVEGQLRLDDPSSWRVFVYDPWMRVAEPITFRTHAGSLAASNPTIEPIRIDGHDALLVTLYLLTEGAKGDEDGPLLYYRTLPEGSAPL